MIINQSIYELFDEMCVGLPCRDDTKAYIISIYNKYKSSHLDFSNDSITLLFLNARENNDFLKFQNIGDWLFFSYTFAPDLKKFADDEYYHSIARLSYYSCFNIINKQWLLFEELADEYYNISQFLKNKIQHNLF